MEKERKMQVVVLGFVGWLQARGDSDPRIRIVDGFITFCAGTLIVLSICIGAHL